MSDDIHKELIEKPPLGPILKPARLDAYQLSAYNSPTISFGMDGQKTAEMLRNIAERIERKEYLAQECSILSRAESDEYQMTFVTLMFHQKKVEPIGG